MKKKKKIVNNNENNEKKLRAICDWSKAKRFLNANNASERQETVQEFIKCLWIEHMGIEGNSDT